MKRETASPRRWAAPRLLHGLFLAVLLMVSGVRLPVADAAHLPVATAARVAGDETRTRFVADLTVPVGYTVYVLANPYRVMIDLPQVAFALPEGAGGESRGLGKSVDVVAVADAVEQVDHLGVAERVAQAVVVPEPGGGVEFGTPCTEREDVVTTDGQTCRAKRVAELDQELVDRLSRRHPECFVRRTPDRRDP